MISLKVNINDFLYCFKKVKGYSDHLHNDRNNIGEQYAKSTTICNHHPL